MTPQVTVIIPTYNRSKLLSYAIRSVLWQTLPDFELWVVGDGCTDDTAEMVASFTDPRVHWHNLPENSGNQSAPINYALEQAQGKYVAYLGHDDLWYPTHLEKLVKAIEVEQADLVHSLCLKIGWDGVRALSGVQTASYWQPDQPFVPPGAVMHTLALVDEIGKWRDYRTVDVTPDREFFGRIRAAQKRIVLMPELTLFKFPAAWRPDSYQDDFSEEQADYFRRIQDQPDFLYRELIGLASAYVLQKTDPPRVADAYRPRVKHYGWQIEQMRRIRGLAPRETPKPTLRQYFDYVTARLRGRIGRYLP